MLTKPAVTVSSSAGSPGSNDADRNALRQGGEILVAGGRPGKPTASKDKTSLSAVP